jgi:hypothetical protein
MTTAQNSDLNHKLSNFIHMPFDEATRYDNKFPHEINLWRATNAVALRLQ